MADFLVMPGPSTLLLGTLTALVGYLISTVLYRLYFHPLAKYPGPKLAAATQLVELYWDVYQPGLYSWRIKEMHEKYGPIIRINPWEIHISDPEFYDVLYSNVQPRDKWPDTANMFNLPTGLISAVPTDLHRMKRAPFNNFFSRRSVLQLSPTIIKHVEKLCNKLKEHRGTGHPISLRYAYSAYTLDVVTGYAFTDSYNALDGAAFTPQWADAIDGVLTLCYVTYLFPWLDGAMKKLPHWVVRATNPPLMRIIEFQQTLDKEIKTIMKEDSNAPKQGTGPTIFHALLHSDALPAFDRNHTHYMHEAQTIVAAGQVTTSYHLNATTYHILANPSVLSNLQSELKAAMPTYTSTADLLPLPRLEDLEYLDAVVHEGHRISYGVTHRLQRVSPPGKPPIIYKDHVIPPGTPVSMSGLLQHEDLSIFPSPQTFDPERFMGAEGEARKKYLVHFSKGTRSCLGQNLANAEIYFVLAALFRSLDMEIYGTRIEDIEVRHDYFTPMPRKGSKGLSVLVK